ncbi:NUDIX domain-containing protein [Cohnella nanjingensis]|uniref:NUDIX domain-containing protein n=1 Tax=Cohnella nanjingensis TaxID=1387779 RepID=A0A7X0VEH2_9BACL|nr:NUDIX domain-containing protein [Cohnella nanjingensis]
MRLIRRITDSDFYGGVPTYLNFVSRQASRGVLTRESSQIAMMQWSHPPLYKLPGGGVEAGEDEETAFLREIKEETGFDAEIVLELGYIEEHKARNRYMQRSHCFIAKASDSAEAPALTDKEILLGMRLRWMTIEEALLRLRELQRRSEDYSTRFMLARDLTIVEQAAQCLQERESDWGR